MHPRVTIYAPDIVRGNIIARRLAREALEVDLRHGAAEAVQAVVDRPPAVLVFDTASAMVEELRLFARCCARLNGRAALFCLGDEAQERMYIRTLPGAVLLPDPLDPERVADLVVAAAHDPRTVPDSIRAASAPEGQGEDAPASGPEMAIAGYDHLQGETIRSDATLSSPGGGKNITLASPTSAANPETIQPSVQELLEDLRDFLRLETR
jgi:DNA-binding NtrC family response regulator